MTSAEIAGVAAKLVLPKPQDYLRPGVARVAKTGRAARAQVGTFKSVARGYAVGRAWRVRAAERHNAELASQGRITAARFLRTVIGADEEFIRAYASAFGRAAAKAHRALFGAEPAQDGLTVIGNHPRFTGIAVYGPDEYPALEQAAHTHKATAALAPQPESPAEPETPAATIVPAKLAREISDRFFERTPGALRTVCRSYVAQRVADIVDGMRRTPANYNTATDRLTDAGAALVTQIISNDGAQGLAWREIGALMDDRENARTNAPAAAPIGA